MYWVVGVGLAYSLVFVGWSIGRGSRRPRHPVPWIIALVFLALDVASHVFMSIGSMEGNLLQGGWVAVGTLAIVGLLVTASLQPALAGWALIGAAVLMPLALLVAWVWPDVDTYGLAPVPVMLGFWSTRAVIVGVLLVASEGRPGWLRTRGPVQTDRAVPMDAVRGDGA